MSLLDEIKQRQHRANRACVFGRWYAAADKTDRADVATAMSDPETFSAQAIADVLKTRFGLKVATQLRDHRRGLCQTCPVGDEYLNG